MPLSAPLSGIHQTGDVVQMKSIQSSNLHAVGYDDAAHILYVRFRSGGLYMYRGVPRSVYLALFAYQSHPWTAMRPTVMRYPSVRLRHAA